MAQPHPRRPSQGPVAFLARPLANRVNGGLRREAVARLGLQPGQAVLDVGCRTGASFPLLRQAVGDGGRIIGIEMDPRMAARARETASTHGWSNVSVLQAPVDKAPIEGQVDAVIVYFVHGIMQAEPALQAMLARLKPRGILLAAGAKRPVHWWQRPIYGAVINALAPGMKGREGVDRPWAMLERLAPGVTVDQRLWGMAYIAAARKPR